MSEIDRDLIPPREQERLLKRALGCAIPEFIARFGAAGAIKRVEAELRRARRARSRKLYGFGAPLSFSGISRTASKDRVLVQGVTDSVR